jgi:hypothetical protein
MVCKSQTSLTLAYFLTILAICGLLRCIEGVHGSGVYSIQNVSESQIQRYLLITLFK